MSALGVDAAPAGVMCDATIHRARPQPAVVVVSDETAWCLRHWAPIAEEMARDGHEIVYTPAALLRLGPNDGRRIG